MLNTGLTITDLAEWARIDDVSIEQSALELMLGTATELVEQELGHDFDGKPVPETIKRSILKLATSDYERRQPGVNFETVSVTQANYSDALVEIRSDLWPYKKLVGF
jgi:hypothetical protein